MRIRYLVSDIDVARGLTPPPIYRKTYHIPGTNIWLYYRWPVNYPARWLVAVGMFVISVLTKPIWWLFSRLAYPKFTKKRVYNKNGD